LSRQLVDDLNIFPRV